ncbi:hypothetical protein [Croceicoccus naphthovorans]|uniref:Uncharacterized protein n=1 Tax=Croceicoccus naphthovorans TaxID=1348774 RepID=A0A0G3XGI0_9SPHN|nr:hypothetical protein [Croceicoccus naphthovorans]AKM09736.1 hypothetical protein AB433_06680 [Croceicoccus naphthovorans]MBB3990725.1 flagellar basal body-associated protein FliL [Croceicoccus naphthovorans]
MVEERITETRTPTGDTHTHTEIIHDAPERSRGGAGWVIAIVLIVALVIGVFFFMNNNSAEVAKDNAVADAANSVGNAAESVGDAADAATDRISQ